jgi:hypothetical protein
MNDLLHLKNVPSAQQQLLPEERIVNKITGDSDTMSHDPRVKIITLRLLINLNRQSLFNAAPNNVVSL